MLTLSPSTTQLDSEIEKQLVNLRGQTVTCEADAYDTRGLVGQYREAQSQMATVLGNSLNKSFTYADVPTDPPALNAERAAVRTAYGLTNPINYDSAAGRAAMVATALKKGISQLAFAVFLEISGVEISASTAASKHPGSHFPGSMETSMIALTQQKVSRFSRPFAALLMAGGLAFGLAACDDKKNAEAPAQKPAATSSTTPAALMQAGALGDKVLGKYDAPVTIIEYASLTCSHCANFHATTFPVLKEKYIDTGKVKLIFREFPLDPLSTAASMMARCSAEPSGD